MGGKTPSTRSTHSSKPKKRSVFSSFRSSRSRRSSRDSARSTANSTDNTKSTVSGRKRKMSKSKKGGLFGFLRKSASNDNVQKTEMTKELRKAINAVEKYGEIVSNLNRAFLLFMQPSTVDCPEVRSKQECEDTRNNSTALAVKDSFLEINQIWNREDVREHADYALYYTFDATRNFQKIGRRVIHSLRSFVNVEFEEFKENKKKLDYARDAMDVAMSEMNDDKTGEVIPAKKDEFEATQAEYNSLSKKIMAFHDNLVKYQSEHTEDIIRFFAQLEQFHIDAVKALGHISTLKANTDAKASSKEKSTGSSPIKAPVKQ